MAPKTKPTALPAQKREIGAQRLADVEVMPSVSQDVATPPRAGPGEVTRPVRSSAPSLDGDREDMATQLAFDPAMGAAITMSKFVCAPDGVVPSLEGLYAEIDARVSDVEHDRSLARIERTLYAQAAALDTMFHSLIWTAVEHHKKGELSAAERFYRLALKSQAQSRATLHALSEVVNPPGVAFVRQANINNGIQQQINTAVPARGETLTKIGS